VKFQCDHCDKLLITAEPGRFTTHGEMSISTDSQDAAVTVECPWCGKDSRFDLRRVGVRLGGQDPLPAYH
jgi:RNase P subunit RPR2